VPLHEHPGALLYRLSRRHRRSTGAGTDGFQRFEVYLGGLWYAFDARHNIPRIGRIVMARGRDAADVAFSTTFGPNLLRRFVVHTDEAPAEMELVERKVA
jgi:transglutaminase-like putative cysteine protease